MNELTIYFPKKLVIGKGTMQKFPDEVIQQGYKKILVVTIEPLLNTIATVIEEIKKAGIDVFIDTSIVQEPRGGDEEARTQVAMGSLYGGFCLGPVNTAGVHALSYPLGSTFHLAHGLSN